MEEDKHLVVYYSVSTKKQGTATWAWRPSAPTSATSTRRSPGRARRDGQWQERGQLTRALELCRRYGATFVLAKIDGLSRFPVECRLFRMRL